MKKGFIGILISVIIALCIIPSFSSLASDYNSANKRNNSLSTPVLTSVHINNDGTVVKWKKVNGASKYRIFYKTGNGKWKKITDTKSTSYTWTKAKTGKKYTFTVRCVSGNGKKYISGYNKNGKSITVLAVPKVSQITNVKAGVKLSWGKVKGAEKYRVLRKTGNKGWTIIGSTASTSFTDKTAKNATNYTYTVRCISKSNSYTSGYKAAGNKITFLSPPSISSVYINNAGAVIKWNKVKGAEKYRVFCKTENGNWKKIYDTTSASCTWKEVKTGVKYTFAVRCLSADGKNLTSAYNTKKSIVSCALPKITSINAKNSGTEIKWNKVKGAEKYKVLRKTGKNGWTVIGTASSTSFIDRSAAKATQYTYTVRCVNSSNFYISGYDPAGMSFTALSVPKISSVSSTDQGVIIKWGSVKKAEKYRVYRKTAKGGWTALTTTASTSFTDTIANSGYQYIYTVRCVTADGKAYASGYNTTGKKITFISTPKISSISATSTGIKLKWGSVKGAEKYKVLRKSGKGKWTSIGVTAYNNFTDIQAIKGKSYTYTVRCVNITESKNTSAYDTKGKSARSISSPPKKNDMVRVAESQLGYSGGKKFWTWAGYKKRVPWCNLFITWCANELGYYQSGRIPLYQSPKKSVNYFKSKGLFKDPDYIPKTGDLIYYALRGETTPYHIGLVEKYEDGIVYTIEGNCDDVVKRRNYSHSNIYIYGYVTPDYGHN